MVRSILIMLVLLAAGCSKKAGDNTPPSSRARLSLISGKDQTGFYGADLHDTIYIKVNPKAGELPTRYMLTWAPVKGNGQARFFGTLYESGYAHPDSVSWLIWTLGCNRPDQELAVFLFPESTSSPDPRNAVDTLIIPATGVKPAGWARACGLPPENNIGIDLSRSGNRVFCLYAMRLFHSEDGGVNWQEAGGLPVPQRVEFYQVNSQGLVYVVTQQDGMFTSGDLQSWQRISDGISDPRYPTALLVEDSVIWASFNYCGLQKSTNNGHSWKQVLINGGAGEGYRLLKRAPDGALWLFDKWSVLWRSADNGATWVQQALGYPLIHSPVSDLAFDGSGNLLVGSNDALLSVLSPLTLTGPVHSYYQQNSNAQYIDRIGMTDSSVYYIVRYTPKPGLYSSAAGWCKVNTGFPREETDYLRLPGGEWIYGAREGVYYFGK